MPGEAGVTLGLLQALLQVDEDARPRQLVAAARTQGWSLPVLVLSVLERDGHRLGSGSRDELARARARHRTYARVASRIAATAVGRVVKGSSIAGHYPRGLLRPVGDVDVILPDEGALWQAARAVLDLHAVQDVDVTLFGHPERHLLVTLSWAADDPYLDARMRIELCTAAYAGNLGTVGVRAVLPEDPLLGDLLALAEERFQRPFGTRDVVDVLVLGQSVPRPAGEVVAAADRYLLAPELTELLELALGHGDLGFLGAALEPLRERAGREQQRRSEWTVPTPGADLDPVGAVLAAGRPVGGLLLERAPRVRDLRRAVIHHFAGGALFRTPLGDYLLTGRDTVGQAEYDSAMAELARLDDDNRRQP